MSDLDQHPEPWLTKREAATYARVSPRALERATREGKLRAAGTVRARRFRREWIDAWLLGQADDDDSVSACGAAYGASSAVDDLVATQTGHAAGGGR